MRERILTLAIATLTLTTLPTLASAQSPVSSFKDGDIQIIAEKMCCKGCAQKVSGQLYTVKGVNSVGVDLSTHTVSLSLPTPSAATLGRVWHAVEQGEGGPTLLTTSTATYRLVRPQDEQQRRAAQQMGATQDIVIDNLHCTGCAQKIAARLYALKGVKKVSVDMQREILTVEANLKTPVSPWLMIDAVSNAKERAVAIRGNYGTLAITWASEAAQKSHHQAHQPASGGIQR